MSIFDDLLAPSASMLGPQGPAGTAREQGQPKGPKIQPKVTLPPQPKPPEQSSGLFDDLLAPDPMAKWHGMSQAGTLGPSMARRNKATEANAAEGEPGYGERLGMMLERGASQLPGGETALTLGRMANGWPRGEAVEALHRDVDTAGQNAPGVNIPLLGGRITAADLPAAMGAGSAFFSKALGRYAVPAAGAAYGAAQRLTRPDEESTGSRVAGTLGHGMLGGAFGWLGQTAGSLGAKASAATGMTDLISRALARAGKTRIGQMATDLSESIGSKGAANTVAADREALQRAVGGEQPPATVLANETALGRVAAKPMYEQAAQEANTMEAAPGKTAQQLAGMNQIAARPQLPAPGQSAIARRDFGVDPQQTRVMMGQPGTTGPETLEQTAARDFTQNLPPGEPLQKPEGLQEDFTVTRPIKTRAANDMSVRGGPPGAPPSPAPTQQGPPDTFVRASNAVETALGDPHVQMQYRSLIGDDQTLAAKDPGSYEMLRKLYVEMNREWGKLRKSGNDVGDYWHALNNARRLVGKAIAAKGPTIKTANRTFEREVGTPEEGIQRGASAVVNPTGNKMFTRSPEALEGWTSEGRTPELRAKRQESVAQGVGAMMGQKIRGVPFSQGTRGVLKLPIFDASESGAATRRLAFKDPQQAAQLEDLLSRLDRTATERAAAVKPRGYHPIDWALQGPAEYNYLKSGRTQPVLRDVAARSRAGTLDLSQFERGQGLIDALQRLLQQGTGAVAGERWARQR